MPFPAPPLTLCKRTLRLNLDPQCPYRPIPAFADRVKAYYDHNHWQKPPSPYEAHHIKPIACGGVSNSSNGILLPTPKHKLVDKWWDKFDKSICEA